MPLATHRWVDHRLDERRDLHHPPRLDLPSAGFALGSKVFFGYKCNPDGDNADEVRIYAGEIDRVAVAQADLTVADDDYVYVRRTLANDTMLIAAAASVPANTTTYAYYPLYQFTVSSGVASRKKVLRAFAIEEGADTLSVVTAVQYDTATCQLQIKTQSIKCTKVGAESAWTMITGGQAAECDV